MRPYVLADLVDDILVLMGPQLAARRIEVAWAERAASGPSLLDRNQIEQVLVNVVAGLTVVREILAQHRFGFEMDNAETGGARFRMRC